MLNNLLLLLCLNCCVFAAAAKVDFAQALNFWNATPRYISLNDNGFGTVHHSEHNKLGIINGKVAYSGQFCYQCYLRFSDENYSWLCGGSLISPTTIMTAAHCVQGALSATAVLGTVTPRQPGRNRVIVQIPSSGLRLHEDYDPNKVYNDIGILKMPKAVKLNQYVCTVKLPSCSTTNLTTYADNNNDYTITGWGRTSDDSEAALKLMYAQVAGLSQNSCANYYKRYANYVVIQSQMCTSSAGGKSTCQGDSGGPVVQPDLNGNLVQQGIVSLGTSSCESGAPSVHTKTSLFASWICAQLKK